MCELGAISYEQASNWKNAAYGYLRAAESYKLSGLNEAYARGLVRKAEKLFYRSRTEFRTLKMYQLIREIVFEEH